MKKAVVLILIGLVLNSCLDNFLRSRRSANMKSYPPEKMFEGKELAVARAIYKGKPMEVEQLIKENKIDINHISKNYGYTFLMYACILEDMQVMNKLLYMGADPNLVSSGHGSYDTPAGHATALNNYKMLNLLLDYKVNFNNNIGPLPLNKAMVLGGFDKTVFKMLDFLLEHGADPNHISYGDDLVIVTAFRAGGIEITNYLLDRGANPDIKGRDIQSLPEMVQYKINQFNSLNKKNEYYTNLIKLKQRLENQYHIAFPVKIDSISGYKVSVELYEKLPERDKKILGERGLKKYEENKKKLAEISKSRFFD